MEWVACLPPINVQIDRYFVQLARKNKNNVQSDSYFPDLAIIWLNERN
jgi:hypothetical protein